MRIATWNVNSVRARAERLAEWLRTSDCDVVCLQETKCDDSTFPAATFAEAGYQVAHHGAGPYNGVAVASRVGLDDVAAGFGDGGARLRARADPDWEPRWLGEPRLITATCGEVRVVCAYAPNGRTLNHPHLRYKLAWLDELAAMIGDADDAGETVVAGDLNVAPLDVDVDDPRRWRGRVLVSLPERQRIEALTATGWVDLWRDRNPAPLAGPDNDGFTWWELRDPTMTRGLRLDLILVPPAMAERVVDVVVDRDQLLGPRPSDHVPVIAELR